MYNLKTMQQQKQQGQKIVLLTAYDYPTAQMAVAGGVHYLLVGDSLGMVCLGYESTVFVTMEDMISHVKAVKRGAKDAFIIADLPFMSYATVADAIKNSGRLLQEGGAAAVKLEGGADFTSQIKALINNGVPVMGHLGLTPQSVNVFGGYKTQVADKKTALKLLADAQALQEAGVFAIVLEMVPAQIAELVTKELNIPTIGIGAGNRCDGQVQVFHDISGLFTDFTPRHAKKYVDACLLIQQAISDYVKEVQEDSFPSPSNARCIDNELLEQIKNHLESC